MEGRGVLGRRQLRSVYLVTYSQANSEIVDSRESFVLIVLDSFENADPKCRSQVKQWVCSEELHKDGGKHYHMVVKLDRSRRWLQVRDYADNKHGVKLNFSSTHANYYSGWKYATKEDKNYLQSASHPDLRNAPQTQEASEKRKATKGKGEKPFKRKRKPRLSTYEVSQIAVDRGIHSRMELLALAKMQKSEGKWDLVEFIANRGYKAVDEAIKIGWDIERAPVVVEREKKSRMELLQAALEADCTLGCNKRWVSIAQDILKRNVIAEDEFCNAVKTLISRGRGKYRNLLLVGPADCGKTFLLNPLNKIFHTFCNPATGSFAWVGADQCEVIFLNDFRWSEKIIPWHDFLLLLEGQPIHLAAPKSHYMQDIEFTRDSPVFCTSKDEIVYFRGGALDSRECDMMRVRWRIFRLHAQIPPSQQVELSPCSRCFAEFILGPS